MLILKYCEHCGKYFTAINPNQKYCCKACRLTANKIVAEERVLLRESENQLCWRCGKACGKCAWSQFFIPIRGWEAKQTIIKDSEGEPINSYEIKKCPEFISDGRGMII